MAKFFDWKIIVILIILAIFVFRECSRPLPVDPDTVIYKDSVKVLKSEKAIISARIEANEKASIARQKRDSLNLALSLKEIVRLKAKANQAVRNIPVKVIEENPEIMIAIVAKDSVINKQGQTIDSLQASLAFQIQVKDDLMSDHYDEAKINMQLQEMAEVRIVKLENDLRKEKRKGKFRAIMMPIIGVGALLVGSQL